VANLAIAQAVKRYHPVGDRVADNLRIAVIEEEEELVVPVEEIRDDHRSADIAAKLILDQVVPGNDWRGVVAEPAISYQVRIAMVLVQVPMKLVRAALCDQVELASAGRPARGLVAGNIAMEFFNGINRSMSDDGAGESL